jgi:hypothetical protein
MSLRCPGGLNSRHRRRRRARHRLPQGPRAPHRRRRRDGRRHAGMSISSPVIIATTPFALHRELPSYADRSSLTGVRTIRPAVRSENGWRGSRMTFSNGGSYIPTHANSRARQIGGLPGRRSAVAACAGTGAGGQYRIDWWSACGPLRCRGRSGRGRLRTAWPARMALVAGSARVAARRRLGGRARGGASRRGVWPVPRRGAGHVRDGTARSRVNSDATCSGHAWKPIRQR